MTRALVAAVAALAVAVPSADAATTAEQKRQQIRSTWTAFKSALRHEQGSKACNLMTARYRRVWVSNYAKQTGQAGLGCVTVVEMDGREVYADFMAGERLRSINVTHGRFMAKARTSRGRTVCFYGDDSGWQVNRYASRNTNYCGATG